MTRQERSSAFRAAVLKLRGEGLNTFQISDKLGRSVHSVRYHCQPSQRRLHVKHTQKRRLAMKRVLVRYSGGACGLCGYDRHPAGMDFHHVDPAHKDFNVSCRGGTPSLQRLVSEVDKTVLVCRNCHAEIHAGMVSIGEVFTRARSLRAANLPYLEIWLKEERECLR